MRGNQRASEVKKEGIGVEIGAGQTRNKQNKQKRLSDPCGHTSVMVGYLGPGFRRDFWSLSSRHSSV